MMEIETPKPTLQKTNSLGSLEGSLYEPIDFKFAGFIKGGKDKKEDGINVPKNGKSATSRDDSQLQHMKWPKVYKIGPGLYNCGNTCFLNSVLQCLTYTSALAGYLLSKPHKSKCPLLKQTQFCALCFMEEHVNKVFSTNEKVIIPNGLIKNLKTISTRFKFGHQHDSHEFLIMLIDKMQYNLFGNPKKLEKTLADASVLSKIFSGMLRSTIECLSCGHKSETFERFFDLCLDLQQADSLDKCLNHFFKIEHLEGQNKYRCSKCTKLVNATKRFTIDEPPNVAIVQLKRFNNMFAKVGKHIKFDPSMNISRFFSNAKGHQAKGNYELFAVLVHRGGEIWSGHYYCYVKNSNNLWYSMNDESVSMVKLDEVLKERAYLLFYRQTVPTAGDAFADKAMEDRKKAAEKKLETPRSPYLTAADEKRAKEHEQLDKILQTVNRSRSNSEVIEGETILSKKLSETKAIPKSPLEDLDMLPPSASFPVPQNGLRRQISLDIAPRTIPQPLPKLKHSFSDTTSEALHVPFLEFRDIPMPLWRSKLQKLKFFSKVALWPIKKRLQLTSMDSTTSASGRNNEDQQQNNSNNNTMIAEETPKPQQVTSKPVEKAQTQTTQPAQPVQQGQAGQAAQAPVLGLTEKRRNPGAAVKALNKQFGNLTKDDGWGMENLTEMRRKVEEENPEFVDVIRREKDEYDVDYDRGKLKKVRKPRDNRIHKVDFQRMYEVQKKQKMRAIAKGEYDPSNGVNSKQNGKTKQHGPNKGGPKKGGYQNGQNGVMNGNGVGHKGKGAGFNNKNNQKGGGGKQYGAKRGAR